MRRDGVHVKEAPPKELVWVEAESFLNEYYDSLKDKWVNLIEDVTSLVFNNL